MGGATYMCMSVPAGSASAAGGGGAGMIADRIEAATDDAAAAREWQSPIRLSNAGRCARALGYQHHRIPGEALSGRSLRVFQYGDAVENMMRLWAFDADLRLEDSQREVMMRVADGNLAALLLGHIDGTIEADGALHVIDFKSINTRGFARLATEGVSYEYRCQLNAYMEAAELRTWGLVVYMDKNTQHLAEYRVEYDAALVEEIRQRFLRVLRSTPDALPEREHAPVQEMARKRATGRWVLPWQCSYCAWKRPCWGVDEPAEFRGDRPVWVVEPPEAAA